MVFTLKDKVVLVTGGASGIGLSLAKGLLHRGIKGITLADVNPKLGENALNEIEKEFGLNLAIFIPTDVTDNKQFENAFEKTIEKFGAVDILINNAGIYRDGIWEKEIAINLNGTLHGILLGMKKYLPKFKQGSEALIVNISSVNATECTSHIPVYCGTKLAALGFTRSWGTPEIYRHTNVRIIAVCPGPTETPSTIEGDLENDDITLGEMYVQIRRKNKGKTGFLRQKSDFVADQSMKLMQYAPNGSIWMIENEWPAYQYILPDRSTMKGNTLIGS